MTVNPHYVLQHVFRRSFLSANCNNSNKDLRNDVAYLYYMLAKVCGNGIKYGILQEFVHFNL
jgi:hypothetical protein